MAVSLLMLTVANGCGGTDVTGSMNADARTLAATTASRADQSSARSGGFTVRKDCQGYNGRAGETCLIVESSLKEVPKGSIVTYRSGAVDGFLDSDVIVDPPRPGNNVAFGHCSLSLITGVGECHFLGGTGKFTHFHGSVAVSPLGGNIFAWNGTYGFAP
ncbi:MAG: hypothetical protein ACHQRK_10620 [Gemmatimonadales bacterium]